MARDDGYTRYTVRIPNELYERVKDAAGEKSVNAEIVSTLEQAYPPKSIDIEILADFLEAVCAPDAPAEQAELIDTVNRMMRKAKKSWTMRAGPFGKVEFYPYGMPTEKQLALEQKMQPEGPLGQRDDAEPAMPKRPKRQIQL